MDNQFIIDWCEGKKASLQKQLDLFESGTLRSGENVGAGWVDTTERSIEHLKGDIAEIDRLLSQYSGGNRAA